MRRQANDPYSQNANILFHTIRSKKAAKDTFMSGRMSGPTGDLYLFEEGPLWVQAVACLWKREII